MKKALTTALVCALSLTSVYAGGPFSEAVQMAESNPPSKSKGIEPNKNQFYVVIPKDSPYKTAKCYTDLQLSKYIMSEESHLWCHYIYPSGNYHLVIGYYAACCDNYSTYFLYLTNNNGDYLDKLEVSSSGPSMAWIREWSMDGDVITVYTLKPTQSATILANDFHEAEIDRFQAVRHDCEYVVENGKFKLKREIIYNPKVYTYYEMSRDVNPDFKIRNDNRIPSKVINY